MDVWTFEQDGATPHTHNLSQKRCTDNLPNLIPAERWPPNSPDLNPLDYRIWNELQQEIRWQNMDTKTALIKELKRAVKRIKKEKIVNSINDFRRRLRLILQNKGEYVHKLI